MLAAHLWLLPLTNTDKLTSNLICITFGQPLIQSDLLTHVSEIFPDFRKNVYVIGSDRDSFPAITEKVDCLTTTDDQQVITGIQSYNVIELGCIKTLYVALQLGLSTILEDLVCLQEFQLNQEQSSAKVR